MGNLTKQSVEAWRRGKVPYLEYVIEGNLSKATRILRIIGFHVHDLNMVPQRTVYLQSDRSKNRVLQFTKSGIKRLEEAYSRHYVWNQSQEKKQQVVDLVIAEYEAGGKTVRLDITIPRLLVFSPPPDSRPNGLHRVIHLAGLKRATGMSRAL
jgi:hypothetical protein